MAMDIIEGGIFSNNASLTAPNVAVTTDPHAYSPVLSIRIPHNPLNLTRHSYQIPSHISRQAFKIRSTTIMNQFRPTFSPQ
jgi:hypothetical protein